MDVDSLLDHHEELRQKNIALGRKATAAKNARVDTQDTVDDLDGKISQLLQTKLQMEDASQIAEQKLEFTDAQICQLRQEHEHVQNEKEKHAQSIDVLEEDDQTDAVQFEEQLASAAARLREAKAAYSDDHILAELDMLDVAVQEWEKQNLASYDEQDNFPELIRDCGNGDMSPMHMATVYNICEEEFEAAKQRLSNARKSCEALEDNLHQLKMECDELETKISSLGSTRAFE